MIPATTRPQINARADMIANAANRYLPIWIRVGCLARVHTDAAGHARFATGQLGRELDDLTPQQISAALATAKARRWIDPTSTARCVVLPDCGRNPCEEKHP